MNIQGKVVKTDDFELIASVKEEIKVKSKKKKNLFEEVEIDTFEEENKE